MSPAPPINDWYCRRCGYPGDLGRERCPECGTTAPPRSNHETRDLITTSSLPAWVLMGIGTAIWVVIAARAAGDSDQSPLRAVGCGLALVPATLVATGAIVWNMLRKEDRLHGRRLAMIIAIPWLVFIVFLALSTGLVLLSGY